MDLIIKDFNVNEYASWIISRTPPHNAVIAVEIVGDINEKNLRKSVEVVSQKEENITYTISSMVCGFLRCKEKIRLSYECYDDLSHAINNELSLPFSDGDMLVRIKLAKIARSTYIILCAHHIICDGISIINYMLNIIRNYNSEPLIVSENFPPNKKTLIPVPEKKILPLSTRRTNTITKSYGFKIDTLTSKRIIHNAKIHNISLNSVLSSLLILAYSEAFSVNADINLHIPISLRNKNFNLMFLTSWINLIIKNDELCDYLHLSKHISMNLKKSVLRKEPIINLQKLSNCITNREDDDLFIENFLSKSSTFAISNCGKITTSKTSKKSNIIILGMHVGVNCQSYMGTNDSIVSLITYINNEITIDTCYPSPLVSDEKIENFINKFKKSLLIGQENAWKRTLDKMQTGYDLGGKPFCRDSLYEKR